jgi:hypothetical protein
MPTKLLPPVELEAFCHSCPEPQEVISILKQLGLRLDFQMEAFAPPVHSPLSQLPAQFHFADDSGLSLIYLAGQDSATEEGEHLPIHKSRFWAYAGADIQRFKQITHLAALQWSFTWHSPEEAEPDVA